MTKAELMRAIRQIAQGTMDLGRTEPGGLSSLTLPGLSGDWSTVDVKVTPAGGVFAGDTVWDQVEINGKQCGNRCGGRDEYARLAGEYLAAELGLE